MNPLFAYSLEHIHFRHAWSSGWLVGLTVAALVITALIYLFERGLSLWKRILLGAIRLSLFLLILLALFQQPFQTQAKEEIKPCWVLVLVDVSESMAFADDRKKNHDLEDAALALGKMTFAEHAIPDSVRSEVAKVPRLDIVKGLLRHPGLPVFHKLGDNYRLQFFAFGDKLSAAPTKAAERTQWLDRLEAKAPATHLGDALQQACENFKGQPLAAIIMLSDGASNGGVHPLDWNRVGDKVADHLRVPVFTLPIGTEPENIRLVTATMPQAVFPGDLVPIQVRLETTPGFAGKEVELTVLSEGKPLMLVSPGSPPAPHKMVKLKDPETDKEPQFEELAFLLTPEMGKTEDGTKGAKHIKLDIRVTPLPGESNKDDNQKTHTVQIINEKIKVLYVEGRPRWEYRFLKTLLMRDRSLAVKFLLTEGDLDLPRASSDYISREQLPVDAKSMFDYDMVILGDVPADYFTDKQLEGMEKLVSKNKGSFLKLAGWQYGLSSYAGTPIANLLPVKPGDGMQVLPPDVYPFPMMEGGKSDQEDVKTRPGVLKSQIMALEPDPRKNLEAWKLARPLYEVPKILGVRDGATILATLSSQAEWANPYPLVAWQRYGEGKTMYVASDQFWRLRKLRGDDYPAKFWTQAIHFLTLSRLMGGNKRIYLETGNTSYRMNERVLIQARLLDQDYLPVNPAKVKSYSVQVEQSPAKGESREVLLKPVRGMEDKGIYQGYYLPDREGDFRVFPTAAAEGDYNTPPFHVDPASGEKLDQLVHRELLKELAESSSTPDKDADGKEMPEKSQRRGAILKIRDLPGLHELIPDIPESSRKIKLAPRRPSCLTTPTGVWGPSD